MAPLFPRQRVSFIEYALVLWEISSHQRRLLLMIPLLIRIRGPALGRCTFACCSDGQLGVVGGSLVETAAVFVSSGMPIGVHLK